MGSPDDEHRAPRVHHVASPAEGTCEAGGDITQCVGRLVEGSSPGGGTW